jgi:hypothetical protein
MLKTILELLVVFLKAIPTLEQLKKRLKINQEAQKDIEQMNKDQDEANKLKRPSRFWSSMILLLMLNSCATHARYMDDRPILHPYVIQDNALRGGLPEDDTTLDLCKKTTCTVFTETDLRSLQEYIIKLQHYAASCGY